MSKMKLVAAASRLRSMMVGRTDAAPERKNANPVIDIRLSGDLIVTLHAYSTDGYASVTHQPDEYPGCHLGWDMSIATARTVQQRLADLIARVDEAAAQEETQ